MYLFLVKTRWAIDDTSSFTRLEGGKTVSTGRWLFIRYMLLLLTPVRASAIYVHVVHTEISLFTVVQG